MNSTIQAMISITADEAKIYRPEFEATDLYILQLYVHLLEVWIYHDRYMHHNLNRDLQRAGQRLNILDLVEDDGRAFTLTQKGKALLHLYPSAYN